MSIISVPIVQKPRRRETGQRKTRRKEEKKKFKKQSSDTSGSGTEEDEILIVEKQEYILAAGNIRTFTWEAKGAAALDSCCTASVCGQIWMDMFIEELDDENKEKVEGPFNSKKSFGFGNNGELKSDKYYIIPIELQRRKLD